MERLEDEGGLDGEAREELLAIKQARVRDAERRRVAAEAAARASANAAANAAAPSNGPSSLRRGPERRATMTASALKRARSEPLSRGAAAARSCSRKQWRLPLRARRSPGRPLPFSASTSPGGAGGEAGGRPGAVGLRSAGSGAATFRSREGARSWGGRRRSAAAAVTPLAAEEGRRRRRRRRGIATRRRGVQAREIVCLCDRRRRRRKRSSDDARRGQGALATAPPALPPLWTLRRALEEALRAASTTSWVRRPLPGSAR